MDIDYLKRFVLVGQTLNFRKASEALFISQPTLSHSISALENELGVPLLVRNTKSVKLTHAGNSFLLAAQEIIKIYDDITSKLIHDAAAENNILHIGYVGPALGRALSPWVQNFHNSNPEIDLRLTRHHSIEIKEALESQAIQLALIFEEYVATIPGIEYEVVTREQFKLLINVNHPLARLDSISLADVANEPLLISQRDSSPLYYDKILSLFELVHVTPKIGQKVQRVSDIYRLVDMNLGYAIMSLSDTSYYNSFDLKFMDIDGIDDNELYHNRVLAWKGKLTPAAVAFKKMVDETTLKA